MQNTALKTATRCTQDKNIHICMTKHSYFHTWAPAAPRLTIQTENTTSITFLTQTFQHSNAKHYLQQWPLHNKHSHRPSHSHYNRHKTNIRHIHTSIVSRHLATRGNNKILRSTPPHISSTEQINHTYTKSTPNHIHHYYAPSVTLIFTTHIISSIEPHMNHIVTPGCVDRPRRIDCTAGRWTEKLAGGPQAGRRTPPAPLIRGMEEGRQQQRDYI